MTTPSPYIEIIPPTPLVACDEILRPTDAVCLLFKELGACREWSDFLSDCRRGKNVSFCGLQLHPFMYEHTHAPLYRLADVQDFIAQAKAAGAGPAAFTVMYHDPATRGIIREPTIKADPVAVVRRLH